MQTTMLTRHPENKTARGILKRTAAERQPDGGYKLDYRAEISGRTREETVRLWLEKWAAVGKPED